MNRWHIISDTSDYPMKSKKEVIDATSNEFVYLKAGIVKKISIMRGNSVVFRISKNIPKIPCDNTYCIFAKGKRYLMQELSACYSLSGENERGIISGGNMETFKWFEELVNYLITERRVSAVKGE